MTTKNIILISVALILGVIATGALAAYSAHEEQLYDQKVREYEEGLVAESIESYRTTLKSTLLENTPTGASVASLPFETISAYSGSAEDEVVSGFRRRRHRNNDEVENQNPYTPELQKKRGFLGRVIHPRRTGILARIGKGLWLIVSAGFAGLLLVVLTKKFVFS